MQAIIDFEEFERLEKQLAQFHQWEDYTLPAIMSLGAILEDNVDAANEQLRSRGDFSEEIYSAAIAEAKRVARLLLEVL